MPENDRYLETFVDHTVWYHGSTCLKNIQYIYVPPICKVVIYIAPCITASRVRDYQLESVFITSDFSYNSIALPVQYTCAISRVV